MHIIPCAGQATRFAGIPKYLLPGNEKGDSLLKMHIEAALESNIKKVIVMTQPLMHSYLDDILKTYKPLVLIDKIESKTMTETIIDSAVRHGTHEDIISITLPDTSMDTLMTGELSKDIQKLRNKVNAMLIFSFQEKYRGKFGQVEIDSQTNSIVDISDKNMTCQYPFIWGGVSIEYDLLINFDPIQPTIGNCINDLIRSNVKFSPVISKGDYYDCGNISDYYKYLSLFN
jgi:dTDP-glucose pyrophosphorylase